MDKTTWAHSIVPDILQICELCPRCTPADNCPLEPVIKQLGKKSASVHDNSMMEKSKY